MKVKENNLAYKTESGSIKEFLYNIKQKIVKSFDVEKIILFGSYAYGKPKENSDVDLFIVMKTDKTPAERRVMIGRLFSQRLVPMDFIVKTPQEVKKRVAMGDFFIKKILDKGNLLYDKKNT